MKRYLLNSFIFLSTFFIACQENEPFPDPVDDTHQPINLSGIFTRAGESLEKYDVYLRAIYIDENGDSLQYFHNTPFDDVTFKDNEPTELTLSSKQYYPLSGTEEDDDENFIYLYAFTSTLDYQTFSLMNLRAGEDELLANRGIQKDGTESSEGEGARGSSRNPVETLYFRHVMTQINVAVDVEDTEFKGDPDFMNFRMEELVAGGTYPITAKHPENESTITTAGESGNGKYTMKMGTNYVVPTGANLSGKQLTYLKIDDYVATLEDLQRFTIGPSVGTGEDLILYPGYAYTLTFKINRLKITGIEIKKTDWDKTELTNDDITFAPKILNVDFDEYSNDTENDPITKIILYTDDNKEYVGAPSDNQNEMEFTLLPSGNVKSIELYTRKGLLLQEELNEIVDKGGGLYKLEVELAANGMMKDNDGNYLITTPAQFIKINKDLDGDYKQTCDLEMETLILTEELNSFGNFTGTYDGQGYRINKAAFKGGGIFEENNGVIKNMRISSGTLDATGQLYAGVICQTNNGTIIGCVNEARITGSQGTVGGICGLNNGKVIGCVNSGNLECGTVAGGICGENQNNTDNNAIFACINTGRVVFNYLSNHIHGGICGKSSDDKNNTLSTCFWLNGTATYKIGGDEYAVGDKPDMIWNNVADLSPAKLKNEICDILNTAIGTTSYQIEFIVNGVQTGSVWPIPVIK